MKFGTVAIACCLLVGCANPINQKTASIYYDSALEAEIRGDFAFAERQYGRALINAQIGHAPDEGVSAAMYGLGRSKAYLCKFAEAEPLLLESLTLQEKAAGPEGPIMTKRLFELARFYSDRGRYKQSLPFFERGVPTVEKLGVEASDPMAFADALDDYANALERSGETAKARPVKVRADALRARFPDKKATYVPKRYGQGCPAA